MELEHYNLKIDRQPKAAVPTFLPPVELKPFIVSLRLTP